ncbi:MAG TPA: tetratricopeptide repeat protein [Anaeromyxobacteraceae bacterium]|nr:tetratricopeptide repeat protein [Anaeromyxobacteraceae bacterium]
MRLLAISAALVACGCAAYPKERGERLEQRLDRLEADGGVAQLEGERAAAQKEVQRLGAQIAEMQKKLDALAAAPRPAATGGGARQDELAKELAQQQKSLDEYARRLGGIEGALARLQEGAAADRATERRAARSAPAAAARTAPEPPPRAAPAPAPADTSSSPDPARDKAGYLAFAREQETKGQKAVARDLYEQYVTSFPSDPTAAEAHFRLGELAFGERRYNDAITEFGKVAKDFPRSGQAPDALLRTAESMLQIGLQDDAQALLSEIPKRYPGTPAATRASRRAAELGARPASRK